MEDLWATFELVDVSKNKITINDVKYYTYSFFSRKNEKKKETICTVPWGW